MKNIICLLISMFLLNCGYPNSLEEYEENLPLDGTISVYSSPDLYNLTTKLTKEFCSLYPNVKVEVISTAGSSLANILAEGRFFGFVSHEHYSALKGESIWKIVIGRDIIVPIISSKNPLSDEIYQQGISQQEFAQIFINPKMKRWGTIMQNENNVPINYYMTNSESINSGVANFLNLNQGKIEGIKVENEKELISSIQNDPYAIGFCKMINILDPNTQNLIENIRLLPIDRNGNGHIDYKEAIYDDLNVLARGVWIGKYPKTLINNIYSISPTIPTGQIEVAFLKWVLMDGQQYLNPGGYIDLVFSERRSKIEMLSGNKVNIITSDNRYVIVIRLLLIITVCLVSFFIVAAVIRHINYNRNTARDIYSKVPSFFNEDSVIIPRGLYYDKTHTWAFMRKNGLVKIGIDDFLQHITGPLTSVKMKNTGVKIKKGENAFSIIQKGKQINISAPISGTIIGQNDKLIIDSSLINSSPYSDGWIYNIEPTNWLKDIRLLIMEKKYKEWLKSEFTRFKDFLAITVKPDDVEYTQSVLQDGGELKNGILSDLGPEVWEDFQSNFIDTSK